MPEKIVLRVTNISTSLQFGKLKMDVEPIGDMFYSLEMEEGHVQNQADGTKVFTRDGIRHVLKGLLLTLMIDVDQGQF